MIDRHPFENAVAHDIGTPMIRTRCRGRTVILRFGSRGPLVEALQAALKQQLGREIGSEDDFGPKTFQAVIDFQTEVFGPDADDGIVGPATAAKLGIKLPEFDFEDAISGGHGTTGALRGNAGRAITASMPIGGSTATTEIRAAVSRFRLSEDDWRDIFPNAPDAVIEAFTSNPKPLDDAGITHTRARLAYALANVEHECSGFTIRNLTENINYTAERMAELWPNRFSSAADVRQKYGTARGWQKQAFDDIYGDRLGNRPGTSDGSTYIGRGGPQITGRDGYRQVGRLAGLNLENDPELATKPEHQPAILGAFWQWKRLSRNADDGDFLGCVKAWNGGTNGLADRLDKIRGNDSVIRRLSLVTEILGRLEG
jgi:predicted chitinase